MTVEYDTPVVLSACAYADAGFSVFPLVPRSKIPAVKEWQKTPYRFSDDVPAVLEGREAFGVVLTARDLVIDVDPRNFKPGDKPHVRLFKDAGIDPKGLAVIARTGSGGLHLYFRLPQGVQVRKKVTNYPGIDFLSAGAYVVGVGSTHADTGKSYDWAASSTLADVREAPECLIRLFQRVGAVGAGPVHSDQPDRTNTPSDDPESIRSYAEYLQNAPAAIQGQNGDAQTLRVCLRGRDLGLSAEKTLSLVLEHYNPRCVPDWTPDDLAFKVRNAYTYAKQAPGNALAVNDFNKVEAPTNPLFRGFDTSNGKMTKTLNNVMNYLVRDEYPTCKMLAWDEFNGQVKLMRSAPWMPEGTVLPGGVEWSDTDTVMFRLWLSREKKFDVPKHVIEDAVLAGSYHQKVHPVRDFLNGLTWDGVPRLKTWLIDYANAKDDKYVREVSEKVLLQAVNRIYQPGCKADYVLILEGIQGVGKSSLIEILGGQWYADIVIDPHARDTADAMRGKWFVEFSEMEVTRRADANALKAFITRKVDRFRLAYGRRAQDLPRQCVFVGTINPDATNEYLADSTGNRRFWPVWIKQVDFKALQGVRDQLLAEAVQVYKNGASTHILDREVIDLAQKEQKVRQTSDPWVECVGDWLHEQKSDFVTTKDVWVFGLKGKDSELSLAHQRRIASVLRDLGWEQKVRKVDGKAQRGYQLIGMEILQ